MTLKSILRKQKWYPRPHDFGVIFGLGLESAVVNNDTIIPLVIHDEAQGDPALYNAHPEHASFAEYLGPNCYPDSVINTVFVEVTYALTKAALETDKVPAVNLLYMPIFTTFDDITVNDEVSGFDIGEILELQRETTDRQSFPLYNTVKMKAGTSAATTMHAHVPGLT